MNKSSVVSSQLPSFMVTIVVFQVALYISFFFDIPVVRQVVGFLYLTFIPGFVIVKLMKADNLGQAETVLFSVGLSVAILMLLGLFVNVVGSFVNIRQPLDPLFLVLVLSGFVLLGTLVCYFKGSRDLQSVGLTIGTVVKSFVLCLLPVLTIAGVYIANITGNNSVLLLAFLTVLALFLVAAFSKRLISPKLYLVLVFVIAIALLFQLSLTSNYVQGFDIKVEHYAATLTQSTGFWNYAASFTDLTSGRIYSMISVTILPTIYSNILNMNLTWIFKIIYPLIFALVPLALYLLWRGKFGVAVAFLSVFLFMSQATFHTEMLGLARQMIGEVFFVLLFLILFSKSLSSKNTKILFVIFGLCLIISHYSIAILFAFFISLMWVIGYFTKKPNRHLHLSMVVLFLVLMISWFVYTISSANIITISGSSNSILSGFSDFFNPAFRGTVVMQGIGLSSVSSPLMIASRAIAYATEVFIIIGFFILLVQGKKKGFDFEYFIPCTACLLLLVMCILLPNFALQLNMTRFYHVFLFFLAPLFAIGCMGLCRFAAKLFGVAAKRKTEILSLILITLVLGSYFLFQTSIMYEVGGDESWSLSLSRYRLGDRLYSDFLYVTEPQVSSSEWLSQNTLNSNLTVYADKSVGLNLVSYGGIYIGNINLIDSATVLQHGQFVYLAELYTVYNEFDYPNGQIYNASDSLALQQLSEIYNNGFCEIRTSAITTP